MKNAPATEGKTAEAHRGNLARNMGMALRDIGIPPRPTILVQIDREMEKDEPDFHRLAVILASDVALAAALLKTANSPFFGFNKRVRSVPEALLVLGLKLIVQAIAGFSLRRAFQHVPDMERFWDSSAKIARVSGHLAKRLGKAGLRPEDAYTFGLFRDCGIPVLMTPFPDYRTVLAEANEARAQRFTDIENQRIGLNHADVGATLAESWLLPGEIVLGIRHHHELDAFVAKNEDDGVARSMIALSHLAEHLVQRYTGRAQGCEWEKIATSALAQLDVDATQVERMLDGCQEALEGDW